MPQHTLNPLPLPCPTPQAIALCQAAALNLYTLAIRSKNPDVSEQALFFLTEMEHYSVQTPPTKTRLTQIANFISACQQLQQRIALASTNIPHLLEIA